MGAHGLAFGFIWHPRGAIVPPFGTISTPARLILHTLALPLEKKHVTARTQSINNWDVVALVLVLDLVLAPIAALIPRSEEFLTAS